MALANPLSPHKRRCITPRDCTRHRTSAKESIEMKPAACCGSLHTPETSMIDFPLNLRDRKEYRTWLLGSQWLSLDRFERFWPDAGLFLENREAVKAAVRAELRAKYAKDAEEGDDLYYMDFLEDLAKTCFRTINETAGTKDAERLAVWLTGTVLAARKEARWHDSWSTLLYRLASNAPRTLVSHGIPSSTAQKLVEIGKRYRDNVEAIDERIEAADLEPKVGWDLVVYEDIWRENSEGSAFIGLSLLLWYVSFDRMWPEVLRCTHPSYIDALIRWGTAEYGPNNVIHEQVAFPDDVRAAWQAAWRN